MVFDSLIFLLFFPLVFALNWGSSGVRSRNLILLSASYLFYAWWDVRFLSLVLFSSFLDFGVGLGLGRTHSPGARRGLLGLSLVGNLGLLGLFKYADFFLSSLSPDWRLDLVLPVGISFYTFQTMSYTLDVYRGKIEPCRDLLAYLTYVAYFPQLVAGPIERAQDLLTQFSEPRIFRYDRAVEGCRLILYGAFKKMVLADNLATICDAAFRYPDRMTSVQVCFATLCFAFQIYGDFSGYSDMAVGFSRLLGIRLSRNFAYPYFSQNVSEFWRRWHITLSSWFRDYLFIPLGGSRGGEFRTARNLVITFALSGLWHGANWTFLVWGLFHGTLVIVHRQFQTTRRGPRSKPNFSLLGWGKMTLTFALVCLGWLFFRAPDMSTALLLLSHFGQLPSSWSLVPLGVETELVLSMLIHLGAFLIFEWVQRDQEITVSLTIPRALRWAVYSFLVWELLYWGTRAHTTFLYFRF